MPVPSSINDLSTVAGSNSPLGSETPGQGDDHIRALASFVALLRDMLNGTTAPTLTNATVNTPTINTPTISAPTINGAVVFGEGWEIDTSGRLKNTSNEQPGFLASKTGVTDQTSGTAVIFNSETYDRGSVYDGTTGTFTAPVAGVYVFSSSVLLNNNSGSAVDAVLRISASTSGTIDQKTTNIPASQYRHVSLMGFRNLSAGETVQITSTAAFSVSGVVVYQNLASGNNRFSGALLY